MRRFIVSVAALAAMLAVAPRLIASEADELREKAQAMKRQAAELKERGQVEPAEDLARKAAELAEAAERLDRKRPEVSGEQVEEGPGSPEGLAREAAADEGIGCIAEGTRRDARADRQDGAGTRSPSLFPG